MSIGINEKDELTKLFSKAIDIIFINSPQRTSFGILLGIVCKEGTDIIFQLKGISLDIKYTLFICAGILLFHIPDFFFKHRIDEDLETQMHYLLEAQKHGRFSANEKRSQWRQFIKLIHKKAIGDSKAGDQTEAGESTDDVLQVIQ